MRLAWPIIIGLVATGAGLTLLRFVPMPDLFPYSDAVVASLLTFTFYIGLSLSLPDRFLFNRYERMKLAFQSLHGLPDQATENALRLSSEAQSHANKLDTALPVLKPETAKRVELSADRLSSIARIIFNNPREGRQYMTLIKRAELLSETVSKHAGLMRSRNAKEAEKSAARSSVIAALDAFSGAYEGLAQTKINKQLSEIETSGAIAEQLFERMKGPSS